MNLKKRIGLLLLLVVVLIAVIAFSRYRWSYMNPERAVRNFSNRIERGNIDNLTLTIYYRDIRSTFHFPQSVADFIGREMYEHKIVIDANGLKEHVELLRQIDADSLIPGLRRRVAQKKQNSPCLPTRWALIIKKCQIRKSNLC